MTCNIGTTTRTTRPPFSWFQLELYIYGYALRLSLTASAAPSFHSRGLGPQEGLPNRNPGLLWVSGGKLGQQAAQLAGQGVDFHMHVTWLHVHVHMPMPSAYARPSVLSIWRGNGGVVWRRQERHEGRQAAGKSTA